MRNHTFSIAKGIAIIAMVAGHAEAPELVTNFIYTWHMPFFFIAAGYFFSPAYADNPYPFIEKRFKGLYLPFLKWSLFFLVTHNIWHHFGILNETYGNWTGGVTHPYGWRDALQRLVMIFTSMSGYDEFMAGAFWFFRGLLVASVLFLIFYRLLTRNLHVSPSAALAIICAGAVAFTALRICWNLKIPGYPNGGWRETWGIFFFAMGVAYKRYESRIPENICLFLLYFALICGAAVMHLSGMNNGGRLRDLWSLPLTGALGLLALHWLAGTIQKRSPGIIRNTLIFIGDNTLYVFIFHILAFKTVSLAKILWYGLEFEQIGCHMVIHHNHTDFFWVVYTIAGTALPLLCLQAIRRIRNARQSRQLSPSGT